MNLAVKNISSGDVVKFSAILGICFGLMLLPDFAAAQGGLLGCTNKLFTGLDTMIKFLNGGVARAIAILAVIAFGIGALSGRVDWIKALQIVMAIGIVFSAALLVDAFVDTSQVKCAGSQATTTN